MAALNLLERLNLLRYLTGPAMVFALVLLATPRIGMADETTQDSNYMPAIRQELTRLDLDARCDEITSLCTFVQPASEKLGEEIKVVVHLSNPTKTIYIYIDKYLLLDGDQGPSLDLSRQLLELNRQMVTAKFEWDSSTNSIRLSTTINTDSNFDRKAFRSQLKGLLAIALKVRPALRGYVKEQPRPTQGENKDENK